MNAIIILALPVFAVIAVGLAAGRLGLMTNADSQTLNKFVFRFAMPAALFGLTATTPPPNADYIALAGAYAIAGLATIFGAYALSQILFPITKQEAGAHAFASTMGNAVFLGLPIALTIDAWTRPYVVLMLVEGIGIITVGATLIAARQSSVSINERIKTIVIPPLKNPLVVATAGGFIFSAIGLKLPESGVVFFDILGAAAGPAALFSLGLFLATTTYSNIGSIAGRASTIVVAKMAFLPAVALTTAYLLGVDSPAHIGALALFTFMPSAVTTFVMASQYGVYKTESAAALLLSTLCAVLTVSGVLIVFA